MARAAKTSIDARIKLDTSFNADSCRQHGAEVNKRHITILYRTLVLKPCFNAHFERLNEHLSGMLVGRLLRMILCRVSEKDTKP